MIGCVKRRSTRTTTVLSCLSLTTTPCNVRFGISRSLRLGSRALLRRNCLDAGDIAADLPHPRGVLELSGRALKAQIEPLLLELQRLVVELIDRHGPEITRLHGFTPIPRCAR